jgi:hypothetical protein
LFPFDYEEAPEATPGSGPGSSPQAEGMQGTFVELVPYAHVALAWTSSGGTVWPLDARPTKLINTLEA